MYLFITNINIQYRSIQLNYNKMCYLVVSNYYHYLFCFIMTNMYMDVYYYTFLNLQVSGLLIFIPLFWRISRFINVSIKNRKTKWKVSVKDVCLQSLRASSIKGVQSHFCHLKWQLSRKELLQNVLVRIDLWSNPERPVNNRLLGNSEKYVWKWFLFP